MILIRAIPFCQVSKQGYAAKGNAIIGIGGWKSKMLDFVGRLKRFRGSR
jgi:hypothetical protein